MAVRTHRLASRWIPALLATVVLAACGDNPTGPWRFQRVVITPNGSFPGGRGATGQFEVAILNNLGDIVPSGGFNWNWSSSNSAVLTIDENGVGTAVGVGTTQVRAQSAGLEGLVTVSVNQIPTSFALVEGGKQSAVVGKSLATPVTVKLLDAGGAPIGGQTVLFSATAGGVVGTKSAVTAADGVAKTTWQLGTKTSEAQTLTATMGAVTLNVPATPLPDVPTDRRAIGTNQNGWGLEPVDTTLTVWITDRFGNPVPDVAVTWAVTSGGGSMAQASAKTSAGGTATAIWTLGSTGGAQTASAAMSGLQSVAFAAVARDNAIVSGTVQTTPGALAGPAPVAARPRPASRAAAPVELEYVPGDWIVTFEPAAVSAPPSGAPGLVSPAAVAAVEQGIQGRLAALDAAVAQPFTVEGVSPAALAARVQVANRSDFDAVGAALRAQPGVRSVERNRLIGLREPARVAAASSVISAAPAVSVTDPFYPLQGWSYEMIGLDQAWKLTTGTAAVIVAVVDDGIRPTHSDLAANLTTDGYDFVTDVALPGCAGGTYSNAGDGGGPDSIPTIPSSFPYNGGCVGDADAIGGHGLHVAGTIAAAAGTSGAVGVAPRVRIRPIRVLGVAGVGTSYDIAQGILYAAGLPADNGAGGTVRPSTKAQIINLSLGGPGPAPAVVTAAVQAASAAGSLLIAAAGNDAVNDPFYPAAYPEVISVAAVGSTGGLADYSNWGPTIDIAAPGGDANFGPTHAILSTLWNFTTGTETWSYLEGTSMAAPHVSGVAALILSREPSLTAAQLRARLLTYATPAGDPQFFGAGIVNAFKSLTLGAGFKREPYVRLIDATTGATVQTVKVGSNGTYRISHLPIGTSFRVFAGLDEDGDATIGGLGRSFGAFGGEAGATINATTTRVYDAPITIGTPSESGGNTTAGFADYVPLGGYVAAQLGSGLEDWFTTMLPAGTYTFGTTGLRGGCGVAGQVNTRIELYNTAGNLVAQNDDGTGYDFCGKVTQTLAAGQYWVRVVSSSTITFAGGGQVNGTYRFYVRSGS